MVVLGMKILPPLPTLPRRAHVATTIGAGVMVVNKNVSRKTTSPSVLMAPAVAIAIIVAMVRLSLVVVLTPLLLPLPHLDQTVTLKEVALPPFLVKNVSFVLVVGGISLAD